MEKTAVDWFNNSIFELQLQIERKEISLGEFAVKRVEICEQAKEMEDAQRKNDFRAGWHGNKHKDWNCEFYLIKHINNNNNR